MADTDKALSEAIKQIAQAKVAEALGGDILDKMITAVMNHRSSYGSDKKTMFESMVEEQIRSMLQELVREYLAAHRGRMQEAVSTALTEHADKCAATIIDAFVNDDWRAHLQIIVPRERE